MKFAPQPRDGTASATLTPTLLAMLVCSASFTLAAFAADPSWWSSPGTGSQPAVMGEEVVTNDGLVSTNYITNAYAVVVQGQLKQFTARAVDEMNAYLPGGAGTNLNALVTGWSQDYATNNYSATNNPYAPYKPSDFTAMTVGQLKQVGSLVWSQLVAQGYTNAMPSWLAGTNAGDYSAANLGQLKTVFNFDLSGPNETSTVEGLTSVLNSDCSVTLSWDFSGGTGGGGSVVIYGFDPSGYGTPIATLSSSATSVTLSASEVAQDPFLGVENALEPVTNLIQGFPSSLPNPAYAPPRYVVIDLGTNFTPTAINNNGMVAGNGSSGAAVWSSGSVTLLANGVTPGSNASAIDDSGRVAGWAYFNYAEPSWDLNPDDPSSVTQEHACVWTNATAYPTDLDTQQNSVNAHNDAYTNYTIYSFYQSFATALNTNGIYGVCGGNGFNSVASEFAAGSDPVPADATLNNLNGPSSGPTTGISGAAGTNYCGGCDRTYGTDPLHGNRDIVTNSAIVDGVEFQPDAGYNYLYLKGINAGGLATGYEESDYITNFSAVLWQNGTNTILRGTSTGMPSALNNLYTTNVTAGSPPTTNVLATPQIVGDDFYASYPNSALLWDQTRYDGTPSTNYIAKRLSQLVAGSNGTNGPPWQNFSFAMGINNGGAIIVQRATYSGPNTNIAPGVHSVLLLPCQFKLLNGSTNSTDVDGEDFNGNRPTTISATTNYGYVPSALGATSTGTHPGGGNDALDILGVDVPFGRGRSYKPELINNCYLDSLFMIAKVSPPAATNITYAWGRYYQAGNVTIAHTTTNTWYVNSVLNPSTGLPLLPTGVPDPEWDTGPKSFNTNTPTTNFNVVAIYDNPGMYIPYWTNNAPNINDIAYHKFAFTYYLTNSIGSISTVATQQVGQIMAIRRLATNNVVTTDWTNQVNIVSTTNIPSPYFTTNEIKALVAPSTDQIIFSPNVLVKP